MRCIAVAAQARYGSVFLHSFDHGSSADFRQCQAMETMHPFHDHPANRVRLTADRVTEWHLWPLENRHLWSEGMIVTLVTDSDFSDWWMLMENMDVVWFSITLWLGCWRALGMPWPIDCNLHNLHNLQLNSALAQGVRVSQRSRQPGQV